MSNSVILRRLGEDITIGGNKTPGVYLPLTAKIDTKTDNNYSKFTPLTKEKNKVKASSISQNINQKEDKSYMIVCKRYLLTFFIFIILSHPEFDMIANIDEMMVIHRIILKALVFMIIQIILNNTL